MRKLDLCYIKVNIKSVQIRVLDVPPEDDGKSQNYILVLNKNIKYETSRLAG